MIPGEMRVREAPLRVNADREKRSLVVVNNGDRPVQVGSHLHLAHANSALHFDRAAATGFRLDIPAGTAVRFEPGVSRTVGVVALGGQRDVVGLQIGGEPPEERQHPPKPFVPFGTPGAESEPGARALSAPAYVSDEAATNDAADAVDGSDEAPADNTAEDESACPEQGEH